MSTESQDTALLTNIEGGGLTALEAKYHLTCLTINLRTGTILFLEKGKALHGILMENRREGAFVRTWPNYDTWLDVAQANIFLENKVGRGKSRFTKIQSGQHFN